MLSKSFRGRAAAGLAVLGACALAACGGPGTSASTSTDSSASADTSVPRQDLTVTMWDQEAQNPINPGLEAAISQFEKLHPNISIKRVAPPGIGNESTVESTTKTKLAVSGSNPPTLVEGDTLPGGVLAPLIQAGLMRDMGPYVDAYGWDRRFRSIGGLTLDRYSNNTRRWGEGPVYGVPWYGSEIGVFYNRRLLEQIGVPLPKTFADFEASLAAAKRAGITPIVLGNSDRDGGGWLFNELLADFLGAPEMLKWVLNKPGATITGPDGVQAAQTMKDWADAGYFTKGYEGISLTQQAAQFGRGEGLYMIALHVLAPTKDPDGFGFFYVPDPNDAGRTPATVNNAMWSFGISANAPQEEANAAAAFLDYLSSPQMQRQLALRHGSLPVVPVDGHVDRGAVYDDLLQAWNEQRASGTALPFLGSGTPLNYTYTTSIQGVQDLLAGRVSPAELLDKIEEQQQAYVRAGK
ncbi:ABC transporter substrate-binding protein [Conexibacter woesei]|uniref:ABC transporter substrate-binding protein n=1 Tax=Conexibacter woesei TaxID=191495 RepID=UPI0011D29A9F|nr:extracellular solute-binding protein [Conexibacter woesei]